MACAITQGYALDCKDTVGGLKNLYFAALSDVATVSQNASGYVTAITMASTKKFYKYELMAKGSNTFVENIQTDPANGTVAYEPTYSVTFAKLQFESAYKFDLLIKNRTVIIGETKDGSYFISGISNGMESSGGSAASGQAMNDFQGYTLTFTGMEKTFSPEVDSTIIAALL